MSKFHSRVEKPQRRFSLISAWPLDALQLAEAVERAGRLIRAARRGLGAGCGISLSAWRLLRIAAHSPDILSIAAAARRTRTMRQAVHQLARELERQDLVRRVVPESGKRSLRLVPTTAGLALLGTLENAMRLLLLEVTNDLERQALITATSQLNNLARRVRACCTLMRPCLRRRSSALG